jgi:WD40 repeat protein
MRVFSFSARAVCISLASAYLVGTILTECLFSSAMGQSKVPIQRFGVSEFRLTAKGGHERPFRFSPDGKLIAGANWEEVRLWSFPDGKLLHDFSSTIHSKCIGFAADGKEFLALYLRQMEIYRFNVESGKLIGRTKLADFVEDRSATYPDISADGKWFTLRDQHGHVSVWDTATGKLQFRKYFSYGAGNCAVSHSGVLTVWTRGFVDRYDLNSGEQLLHTRIYEKLRVLASNPQGTLLAGYSPNDKAIIFWDTTNDKQVGGLIPLAKEYKGGLREAALSDDGRRFVFWISRDKWLWNRQVAIYDVETGKLISSFDPPGVYFLEEPEISPDGRYMFLAGGRSVFTPVDVTTGKLVREVPDHILGVETLSFTPDGQALLVGSRDKRQAWNVDTGGPGPEFEKWHHNSSIVAVSNDSALVSGIKGGGIRLQSIATGAVEREYETAKDQYFSAIQGSIDRKTFVGAESLQGGPIRRWNVADGKVISERQLPSVNREQRFDVSKMIRGLALVLQR